MMQRGNRLSLVAMAIAVLAAGTTPALADVRVWTDKEEVILKGTLQGIEVLSNGNVGTVPVPPVDAPPATSVAIPPPDLSAAPLRIVNVASANALYRALDDSRPGDHIVLAPGVYVIERNSVTLKRPGTADHPIVLTSVRSYAAAIRMTGTNGIHVRAPYWVVENLEISGACVDDSTCEHGVHITGLGDRTIIRNNRIIDFNAPIKGSSTPLPDGIVQAGYVLIEGNDIYNTHPRATENPVTGIDVVGGRGWIVRGNYIADLGKQGGNGVSYAAFFKGGSSDGLFERNLVVCRQTHGGGQRAGLSFGGGGSDLSRYCRGPGCDAEHRNGTMRNNIVLSCNDAGIYLNRARNSRIFNNMLYDTGGIDVRYGESTSDIRNNILSGAIRLRDGGAGNRRNNVIVASPVQFNTWFADPRNDDFTLINRTFFVDKGEEVPGLTDDFCGNPRNAGLPDVGPIEFIGARTCNVGARMKMDN
ncbi:MAG: chondroitinase-B domain-containing protein [Alphaproteobacteria bacterium]|jgi:parallel beta-helix repeat protein